MAHPVAPGMKKKLFWALLLLAGWTLDAGTVSLQKPKKPVRRSVHRTARKPGARKLPPPVDPTTGDNVDGDDLTVRRAAADALGTIPGSVVVVGPGNGRLP